MLCGITELCKRRRQLVKRLESFLGSFYNSRARAVIPADVFRFCHLSILISYSKIRRTVASRNIIVRFLSFPSLLFTFLDQVFIFSKKTKSRNEKEITTSVNMIKTYRMTNTLAHVNIRGRTVLSTSENFEKGFWKTECA